MAGLGLAAAWVEVSSLGFSPHQATPRSENLNCCVNGEGTRWTRWVDWEQTELSYYRQPGACGQGHSLHPPASAYGNKKWASLYHFLSLVRMGVANVCKYPINTGPCAEWTQHWFYNWKTSDCESLNFGKKRGWQAAKRRRLAWDLRSQKLKSSSLPLMSLSS